MAQAWHRRREQLALAQGGKVAYWGATEYKISDPTSQTVMEVAPNARWVEAAPNARWKRFTPFEAYRPTSKTREVQAPHLMFLKLKSIWAVQPEGRSYPMDLAYKALIWFAKNYGFLGTLEEDYFLQSPVIPEGKTLIAPEAVIDDRGRLRRVDPATEGKELLRDLLASTRRYVRKEHSRITLPSEIKLISKTPNVNSKAQLNREPRQLVPWEMVREDYRALMILDEESYTGVSVLCTREPISRWWRALYFFPSGETLDDIIRDESPNTLNFYLQGASPGVILGEAGNVERGWRCRNLLQAMYVMLYLDLTGDNAIRRCQSRGCPGYFHVGSQITTVYCSKKCANRASTRMGRGQEP
jgi:hypothetical protein